MPYTKTSLRAGQRALREEMRALGMSRRQVAAEFACRYRLRPRAAWRHAHGWSLTEAAQQINAYAAQAGLSGSGATVAMTAAHLCEHENWPGEGPQPMGRKPTPYLLSLLAAVYGCATCDLLDVADCRRLPPADRLTLDKTAAGREDHAAPPPGSPPARSPACLPAVPPVSPLPEPAGAAVAPELAALAAALLGVPREQGRDQAARVADQVNRIWKLRQAASYRELAAGLPQALLTARMTELEPAKDRPLADLAALTHLYNAASSLAKSLGSFDLAGIAADRAVSTADRSGDPLLGGAAAYRLANVLLSAGQLGSTQAVAVTAADRLRPVMTATRPHTALWGALLATAALAAARRRRRAGRASDQLRR